METHRKHSHVPKCSRIILKCGKDIHCPKISNVFDYGGSVSLNMRIPFNEEKNLGITGLIFQAKVTKFGANVG